MLLRLGNTFIIDEHILRFSVEERDGRVYLDVECAPRVLEDKCLGTAWAHLNSFTVPEHFDFEMFLNAFWREVRQGRHLNVEDLVYEAHVSMEV